MLKSLKLVVCLILFFAITDKTVNAGPFSDTFTRCLIRSVAPTEKSEFVQWMFFSMSKHPSLKSYANVSDSDTLRSDKLMAVFLTRLLSVACKKEFKEAVKFEGENATREAFSFMGRVAVTELLKHPKVEKSTTGFTKFMELEKMRDLLEK
jgi:hypothetical protein